MRITETTAGTCLCGTVRFQISGEFESYFLPAGAAGAARAQIEEGDAEPFENGIIDMGEAVAESVALALDPYPKKSGVEFSNLIDDEGASGHESGAESNPFAGLGRLREGKG